MVVSSKHLRPRSSVTYDISATTLLSEHPRSFASHQEAAGEDLHQEAWGMPGMLLVVHVQL